MDVPRKSLELEVGGKWVASRINQVACLHGETREVFRAHCRVFVGHMSVGVIVGMVG